MRKYLRQDEDQECSGDQKWRERNLAFHRFSLKQYKADTYGGSYGE